MRQWRALADGLSQLLRAALPVAPFSYIAIDASAEPHAAGP